MLYLLGYLILAYIVFGVATYVYGHPKTFLGPKKDALKNREGGKKSIITGKSGPAERYAAHAVQAVNFVAHRATQTTRAVHRNVPDAPLYGLYAAAVGRAFGDRNFFITTGSPHSRAMYLRNFAWFYPTLLDPGTILDEDDARRRIGLLTRSLNIIFESRGGAPYTTTLVPLTPKRFAAVNYFKQPSDSLLGVLAGLETLLNADPGGLINLEAAMTEARNVGTDLFDRNRENLQKQIDHLLGSLRPFSDYGISTMLIDRDGSKSSATDTRIERRRFVANANVWSTLDRAVGLGLIEGSALHKRLGRTLAEYKHELLRLFGKDGAITNSLDDYKYGTPNIVLDFAHVYHGFWSFLTPEETKMFKSTADMLISDPKSKDKSGNCFLISSKNPKIKKLEHVAVASYHGRTVWPAFNVEFADRLTDLSLAIKDNRYRDIAHSILQQIERYILANHCYPEVLNPGGRMYSTMIYRSARADSWFPRFISVRAKLSIPQTEGATNRLTSAKKMDR